MIMYTIEELEDMSRRELLEIIINETDLIDDSDDDDDDDDHNRRFHQ